MVGSNPRTLTLEDRQGERTLTIRRLSRGQNARFENSDPETGRGEAFCRTASTRQGLPRQRHYLAEIAPEWSSRHDVSPG